MLKSRPNPNVAEKAKNETEAIGTLAEIEVAHEVRIHQGIKVAKEKREIQKGEKAKEILGSFS